MLGSVVLAGSSLWLGLLAVNLALSPALPWSVAVMALLLGLVVTYLDGRWGPGAVPTVRRLQLRARVPHRALLAWALVAGALAMIALAGLWFLLFQLAGLPSERSLGFSRYPAWTVLLAILMASLVSAVTEEAGFRGYLQSSLERRLPGMAAVVLAALLLAPAHALTQGFVWPVLIFYLLADTVFGTMALLAGSIVPGLLIHTLGLVGFFLLVWQEDVLRSAGLADPFRFHLAQAGLFGLLAMIAFVELARRSRLARVSTWPSGGEAAATVTEPS